MKIQYCSDLHLEFRENRDFLKNNPLKPEGDILVLAGDIVPFSVQRKHSYFFDYVSSNFSEVYWVPGNHEFYHSDIKEYQILNKKNIRDNVFLINNTVIERNGVRLIFSCLWSNISPINQWNIQQSISDFHVIYFNDIKFHVIHFNELHKECMSFLTAELHRNYTGKTVVVTHHVPTFLNYPEKYKGDVLNEAFAVELYDLIAASKVDYWIFGHHHKNVAPFEIGSTKLVTNQLGYVKYNECPDFDLQKIINI
jgi:predicted phosphodiesterase